MRDVKKSVAFYSVSADVDGLKIAQGAAARFSKVVVPMLESAREPLTRDAQMVSGMLQGVLAGASRGLLESAAPERRLAAVSEELIFLVGAYLKACPGREGKGLRK
jgi:hypothetical protein